MLLQGPPLPPLPPLRALGPPAYNRPPPAPQPPPPPNQYPSTPGGGRFGIRQPPPKHRSSPMRGSTFAAGNHVREAVQGNDVKKQRPPEDPNGIEYLPETLPSSGGGMRPPYIKYNSFANY